MSNLVDLSIEELEVVNGELLSHKQRLSAEKQALQGQLGVLKAKCTIRLSPLEYHKVQTERGQVVNQLSEKEVEIGNLNIQLREVMTVLEVRKRQSGKIPPKEVKELVGIRDRWHDFSMDPPTIKRHVRWLGRFRKRSERVCVRSLT
jgi:hypothetical protein